VPSKTVIESARAGLAFDRAFDRARAVVAEIASTETADVLRREGVVVLEGEGELLGPSRGGGGPTVRVGETDVDAKGVVLALGSRPLVPPIPGLTEIDALTSENLWDLREAPSSLAVIGGGSIGCELSQALSALGVDVSIVELADRLLSREDPPASAIVAQSLEKAGVAVRAGVGAASVSPAGVSLSDGSEVTADRVFVAVGRSPNSDRGGVIDAGVAVDDRGFVVTGANLSTSLDGVYAAGDITGLSPFTHAADLMGRIAAANVLSRFGRKRFDPAKVPAVTFTDPEVASIGLTEAEAAAQHDDAMVAELPLSSHDRAIAAGRTDGYIKLIAGPNPLIGSAGGGRLVGATIVADRAGEMIAELALAMQVRAFVGQLAMTAHPYPTWSYGIPKAAAQFFTTVEGRSARPARADGATE
jgi:pyruvate/2-oxoglutarate dehydrogenase complex dihydrolipoamide dehydrogenase (E3) component